MNEEELHAFVQKHNKENQHLEYKLKPDFNEIKSVVEQIMNRVHFKILKTIYAFANTEGGYLYVGIRENKKAKTMEVVGLDKEDEKRIKSILNKVSPQITIKSQVIELKIEKRIVIKITVNKLRLYDKPQLLNGTLYLREKDKTKIALTEDWINKERQLYLYMLHGIKSNLDKMANEQDEFMVNQFIEGLKSHIKQQANKNNTAEYETTKKAIKLLDDIKSAIQKKKRKSVAEIPDINDIKSAMEKKNGKLVADHPNTLIDNFVKAYKAFIDMEA